VTGTLLSKRGVDGGVRGAWLRRLEVKLWGIGIEREGVPSATAPESLSADSVGTVSVFVAALRMRWCWIRLPFSISISSLGAFGCCASASSFADNLSLRAASTGPNTLLESAWLFFLVRLALSPLAILCVLFGWCWRLERCRCRNDFEEKSRRQRKRGDQKPKIRYCGGGPWPATDPEARARPWTFQQRDMLARLALPFTTQKDARFAWKSPRLSSAWHAGMLPASSVQGLVGSQKYSISPLGCMIPSSFKWSMAFTTSRKNCMLRPSAYS